jgi:hypothetical protein
MCAQRVGARNYCARNCARPAYFAMEDIDVGRSLRTVGNLLSRRYRQVCNQLCGERDLERRAYVLRMYPARHSCVNASKSTPCSMETNSQKSRFCDALFRAVKQQ